MVKKKFYAYTVTWRDSCDWQGWHDVADKRHAEVGSISSIGWCIALTPSTVVLTTSLSNTGDAMDSLAIPREAVIKMRRLPHHVLEV